MPAPFVGRQIKLEDNLSALKWIGLNATGMQYLES
jgi:hypothetical protein